MTHDEKDRARILRQKAEASTTQYPLDTPDLSVEEARRLVHELQVHQIELEMQNEELHRIMGELEQSRNQFSLLFHQAPVGYLVLDEVGLIHEVNETFCCMINQQRSQLIGKSFADCLEGDDHDVFLGRYRALFKNPTGKSLEMSVSRTHASAFFAQIKGTIFSEPLEGRREKGAPLLLLAVTDITERKRAEDNRLQLERQMQQTQKLESLGVLAGGIAHDFNNLLTSVLGNASLAIDEIPPLSPARDSLQAIEKTSLRAAELCRQMLAYSGKGRLVIENIQINDLVQEMVSLFRVSMSKKAILSLNLENSIPLMRGDPSQIRQVVMNLVINASEAMGEHSGVVTISTGVMHCNRDYLAESYLNENLIEGLYVWLEVSDTGCGMDQETLRRLFEPFFTTKFTGRGLGLSAVLGIVRGHRGTLRVQSGPDKGTTFRILFSTIQAAHVPVTQSRMKQSEWKGTGTVLLVDDEESVRESGVRMLQRIGFQVLVAADGQEAVERYQAQGDEIALVLLDLTMPRMDGEEAFQQLQKIDSKVRIVLTSGYAETEIAPRFASEQLFGFLQKPYTLDTLTQCLRNALDGN